MMSSISRPDSARIERPSALTTPAVTVCWKPYGEPIATAIWPTRMLDESASRTCWSRGASMRITARSVSGSSPMSCAGTTRASCSVTSSSRRAAHDVAVREDEAIAAR